MLYLGIFVLPLIQCCLMGWCVLCCSDSRQSLDKLKEEITGLGSTTSSSNPLHLPPIGSNSRWSWGMRSQGWAPPPPPPTPSICLPSALTPDEVEGWDHRAGLHLLQPPPSVPHWLQLHTKMKEEEYIDNHDQHHHYSSTQLPLYSIPIQPKMTLQLLYSTPICAPCRTISISTAALCTTISASTAAL